MKICTVTPQPVPASTRGWAQTPIGSDANARSRRVPSGAVPPAASALSLPGTRVPPLPAVTGSSTPGTPVSRPGTSCTEPAGAQEPRPALLLPWRARGRGYVFAGLRGPGASSTPPGARAPSALALVDYTQSPVGPYRELAWQPGEVQVDGQRYSHISHLCVDSPESVKHGRALFQLDKRLAGIAWAAAADGGEQVTASLPHGAAATPCRSLPDQAAAAPCRSLPHGAAATPCASLSEASAVTCRVRPLGTWRVHLPAAWAQWLFRPLWQPPLVGSEGTSQATRPVITPLRVSANVGLAWLSHMRISGALLPPHGAMRLCPLGISIDDFELVLGTPPRT